MSDLQLIQKILDHFILNLPELEVWIFAIRTNTCFVTWVTTHIRDTLVKLLHTAVVMIHSDPILTGLTKDFVAVDAFLEVYRYLLADHALQAIQKSALEVEAF